MKFCVVEWLNVAAERSVNEDFTVDPAAARRSAAQWSGRYLRGMIQDGLSVLRMQGMGLRRL